MDSNNESMELVPLEQRCRYISIPSFHISKNDWRPGLGLREKPPFSSSQHFVAGGMQKIVPKYCNQIRSSSLIVFKDEARIQTMPASRLFTSPSRRKQRSWFFSSARLSPLPQVLNLILLILCMVTSPARASHEEGFFNGHSLLRLESTINLRSRTTLSFMTCTPQGKLLYQERSVDPNSPKKADIFKIEIVPPDQPAQKLPMTLMSSRLMMSPALPTPMSSAARGVVRLTWKVAGRATAQHVINDVNVADGRGHQVDVHYKLGSLIFGVDTTQIIIANTTYNKELFDINLGPPNNGLVIGRGFTGCIQGGVNLSFEPSKRLESNDVAWDRCSSSTMSFGCAAPLVDHCLSQPCRVGSLCRNQPASLVDPARQLPYHCECAARYTGSNCEIDQGPLCIKPENQCLNGGFCVEVNFGNGTRCRCPPRFQGARCEEPIMDYCQLRTSGTAEPLCRNGGTCIQNGFSDGYVCQCAPGWTGAACEIEINECVALQPCAHNGRCTDAVNGYVCDCGGTGYEGRNCEINIDECAVLQQPCGAQGTCFDTLGNYTCSCPPGYEGQRCELEANECVQLQQPCQNGGTCRDALNNYECVCRAGFTGRSCEINVDDCAAGVVCPDGMICVDGVNNSTCECPRGTIMRIDEKSAANNKIECQPISECAEKNIKCENGGICVDLSSGGFVCKCSAAFAGLLCNEMLDPCLADAVTKCPANAVCMRDAANTTHGYACKCRKGFVGPLCTELLINGDIFDDAQQPQEQKLNNVCVFGIDGSPACKNNGTCLRDGPDKFQCVCPEGITGQRCEVNHNECDQHPCMNNATCEDLLGDFKCHCATGWSGRWCHKVFDACENAPCLNTGRCISSEPSSSPEYQCECRPGFTGKRCETQIDHCRNVTCEDARHVCYNLINNYKCDCAPGWTGPACTVRRNECERRPCRNGATCLESDSSLMTTSNAGYTCVCPPGYTGQHCERDIDECMQPISPCKNGAKCDNTPGSYRCFCVPGFIGNDCGLEVNLCLTRPCENNATCVSRINGFDCRCAEGFQGPTCALDVNECVTLPTRCENGAMCLNTFGSYNCSCAAGFDGRRCEVNIDECAPKPCQHGGLCVDGIASFQCHCDGTGFTGPLCEDKINECIVREQPCQNGGLCVDAVNDYSCNCLPALEGKNCTIDIPDCDPQRFPCQNGATCLEHSKPDVFALLFPNETFSWALAAGFTCVCPSGFTGEHCEINIDDCARAQTPCQHGSTCIDLVNEFDCACKPGFEGYYCEQQIDMCRRYRPCKNGSTCANRVNGDVIDYECQCVTGFAGRNCSVELTGCASSTHDLCEHGKCVPYLESENEQRGPVQTYECKCESGYTGEMCGKSSVLSFSGDQSFVKLEDVRWSARRPPPKISFEFRTSVTSDGVLAVIVLERKDAPPVEVQLALFNDSMQLSLLRQTIQQQAAVQELSLRKFALREWTRVDIDLFDSTAANRIRVQVSQNSSTSTSVVKEELVIADTALTDPTLTVSRIWLGSSPLRFEQFIASNMPPQRPSFIGCMRDVNLTTFVVTLADIVRRQQQLKTSPAALSSNAASNVRDLCVAQPRCASGDECGGLTARRGTCVDMWTTHKCLCRRPYYGSECEFEYPAATFGHGSRASKAVVIIPKPSAAGLRAAGGNALLSSQLEFHTDVSFMFRTVETSAFLFYLGNFDRSSYIELHLINSTTLWLAVAFGSNFEKLYVEPTWTASAGGVKLNSGQLRTIRIVRDRNILRVLVDNDRLVIEDTVPGIALQAQVLYVGNAASDVNDGQMMAVASDNSFTISGKSVMDNRAVRRFRRQSSALDDMALPLLSGPPPSGRLNFNTNLFFTSSTTREPFGGSGGASSDSSSNAPITPDVYFTVEDSSTSATVDKTENTLAPEVFATTPNGMSDSPPIINSLSGRSSLYDDAGMMISRTSSISSPLADENFFKGVIQDFRLNDRLVLFTEPPNDLVRSSATPASSLILLRAQQPSESILAGVITDDICGSTSNKDSPICLNNGICQNMAWNDFNCTCAPGFWGKRCELIDYCNRPSSANSDVRVRGASDAPICGIRQATCNNLMDGFECLTPATFNGRDSQITYERQFEQRAVAERAINNVSLELRTREARVEAVLRCRLLDYYLDLGIDGGRIVVDYMLGNTGTRLVSEDVRIDDGAWHTVTVVVNDVALHVYINNTVLIGEARTVQKISLAALILGPSSNAIASRSASASSFSPPLTSPSSRKGLQIDLPAETSKPRLPAASQPTIILGRNFLGCLRNARIGPYLLPFLSSALNPGANDNPAPNRFVLKSLVNVNIGACGSSDACLTATDRCVHGKCVDIWNAYRCECDRGWAGQFCQHNMHGCDSFRHYDELHSEHSSPCKNNGTCQQITDDQIKCWCPPGFTGDRCETEIDECAQPTPLCQNGALCEDLIDNFRCICPPDYTGKLCNVPKSARCADQPCAASDRTLSCTHRNMTALRVAAETSAFALPRRQLPHFICSCADGTEGDTCDSDIRYCHSNPCKNAGVCYEKQQIQFLPTTSVAVRKSATKMFPTATSSTTNSPMAARSEKFVHDERKYMCKCQNGWHGEHCELDIDECTVGLPTNSSTTMPPCDVLHGKCVNEPGSYRCECELGYTGARCQKPDCSLVQCLNGGQCRIANDDSGSMWKCDCSQSKYFGPLCNVERPCLVLTTDAQTQCLNGGVCVDLEPTPSSEANSGETNLVNLKCECPYNYTGPRCEDEVDFCLRNPCVNGNCTRLPQFPGYRCDCYAGWTGFKGVHCEQDIDECTENGEVSPCQNGGICFNLIGSYRCDCVHPFSGLTCAERTGVNKLSIILGASVGVALVIVVVGLTAFCCMAKKKRATRGTYSPSRQEMFGSRVEMNHVMRKPPQERLI